MIKFPISFGKNGFAKLIDGSHDYYTQLLSIAILTEPQTHPFSPRFGAFDPSFIGIDKSLFVLTAAKFVPEVEIISVNSEFDESNGNVNVSFEFRRKAS